MDYTPRRDFAGIFRDEKMKKVATADFDARTRYGAFHSCSFARLETFSSRRLISQRMIFNNFFARNIHVFMALSIEDYCAVIIRIFVMTGRA